MALNKFPLRRFVEADEATRKQLFAELAETLGAMVASFSSFHRGVIAAVTSLRAIGHDLWSIDESDEFEVWGPNYESPDGPGLVITFSADDGVEVEWTER